MRDIVATAAEGEKRIPPRYVMTVAEVKVLHEILAEGKEIDAFLTAFYYGFELGRRATKKSKV